VANATIDRIFDRADVLEFEGKSYRLKGRIMEVGHGALEGVINTDFRRALILTTSELAGTSTEA